MGRNVQSLSSPCSVMIIDLLWAGSLWAHNDICLLAIRNVYIGIIFLFIGHSHWCSYNTLSRVLQADWLILENNEKATLNIEMPYWSTRSSSRKPLTTQESLLVQSQHQDLFFAHKYSLLSGNNYSLIRVSHSSHKALKGFACSLYSDRLSKK